ncbi:MAG: hypothetical protein J5809_00560 [Selenomonadaceae bacterium]|nr:hypothetical protein [Selenomonadaceae bacterium]
MAAFIKGIVGGDEFFTEILIRGLTFNGPVDDYYVGNFNEVFGRHLENKYGVHYVSKFENFIPSAALLFLIFDPTETDKMLKRLAPKVAPTTLIVSVVPDLELETLEKTFPENEIVRLFITPSIISGHGLGAYVMSKNASMSAESVAQLILNNCGDVINVDNEKELDQLADFLTANSYIAYVAIQNMVRFARKIGMSVQDSNYVAEKLFKGAVYTLTEDDKDVATFIKRGLIDQKFRTRVTNLLESQGIKAEMEKFIEKPVYAELIEAEEAEKAAAASGTGANASAAAPRIRPSFSGIPASKPKAKDKDKDALPVSFRWLHK